MSADAWLDPALAAAVARGDVRSVAAPVADGVDALSVPVLAPAAVAAVWADCWDDVYDDARVALPDAARPAASAVADVVGRAALPAVAQLLGAPRLCARQRRYLLRYDGGAVDGGRVFRLHQDDADVTLAVCVGGPEAWTGADVAYARPASRPGTPDAAAPVAVYAHVSGRGVAHAGDAYHRVERLAAGRRATLVVQAMRDDAAWKRDFF